MVRDNIPKIIRRKGIECEDHIASAEEFERLLRAKLREEGEEVIGAGDPELLEELADLEEVKLALMKLKNISAEQLEAARLAKRESNGGFDRRVVLDKW